MSKTSSPLPTTLHEALIFILNQDKDVTPDSKGVFEPYASYSACATRIGQMLTNSGATYYQPSNVELLGDIPVFTCETILIFKEEKLSLAKISIPLAKLDAQAVANAMGWGRRLCLVQAFGLATAELSPEERAILQQERPVAVPALNLNVGSHPQVPIPTPAVPIIHPTTINTKENL